MGWIRLDDRITEHPKIAAAGPLGFAMFVAGIVYCNRNLTDGFIPRSVVATLLDDEWTDYEGTTWTAAAHSGFQGWEFDCLELAEHLASIGLFHKVDGNDDVTRYGYRIHDYENYQPSRAQVLAEREKTASRVQRHRQKHANTDNPQAQSNAGSNAVTNAGVTDPPTPTHKREANASLGKRAPDELWDALVLELGDVSTKTERGERNSAVKELREAGATAADIHLRCRAYRRKWPEMELTPSALKKHWSSLAGPPAREPQPIEVALDLPDVSDEERQENAARITALAASIGKDAA